MGFFFRKSGKFGPLRFNFSKSGVGLSAGVRGARVSTGPRGTFVTVGRNGFYYRQRIDPPETGPGSAPTAKLKTVSAFGLLRRSRRGNYSSISGPPRL